MGPPTPPHPSSPTQGWENGAVWISRGFILDFGGDESLPVHFILFKTQDILPWKGGRCSYKAPINFECVHAVMVLISAP